MATESIAIPVNYQVVPFKIDNFDDDLYCNEPIERKLWSVDFFPLVHGWNANEQKCFSDFLQSFVGSSRAVNDSDTVGL